MGTYSQVMGNMGGILNGGLLFGSLSADELTTTGQNAVDNDFANNSLHPDNSKIAGLYSSAYRTIYSVNMMLENLPAVAGDTAGTMRILRGEAHFLRAILYGYLEDLFGPVPLVLGTDVKINAIEPRSSPELIDRRIMADLLAADSLLNGSYVTSFADPAARTRPNKWSVRALLARVYLFHGDWPGAIAAATDVINSGSYRLEAALDSVFLANSREAIWQLQPVNADMNTAEGFLFLPPDVLSVKPTYSLTGWLLQAFEPADQRLIHWTRSRVIGGTSYVYPYKYRVNTGIYPCRENNMVLRLAEQYLIRAEARAQQGLIPEAIDDLNKIRDRAGLAPLTGNMTPIQVLAAVAQERRIELFAEWGHRWADLKRTGVADAVLAPIKQGWVHTDQVYPIPLTELQRNPNMVQNPGYE